MPSVGFAATTSWGSSRMANKEHASRGTSNRELGGLGGDRRLRKGGVGGCGGCGNCRGCDGCGGKANCRGCGAVAAATSVAVTAAVVATAAAAVAAAANGQTTADVEIHEYVHLQNVHRCFPLEYPTKPEQRLQCAPNVESATLRGPARCADVCWPRRRLLLPRRRFRSSLTRLCILVLDKNVYAPHRRMISCRSRAAGSATPAPTSPRGRGPRKRRNARRAPARQRHHSCRCSAEGTTARA